MTYNQASLLQLPKTITQETIYAIADAFGKVGATYTPRELYNRIEQTSRPYFPELRDTILPALAHIGMLERTEVPQLRKLDRHHSDVANLYVEYQLVRPAPYLP